MSYLLISISYDWFYTGQYAPFDTSFRHIQDDLKGGE